MNESKTAIVEIEIAIDNEMPEYMMGLRRIRGVICLDGNGDEVACPVDLVDNREYNSIDELRAEVTNRLGFNPEITITE